jgi:hypothetical protein
LYRRYQRTHNMMTSAGKCRHLKKSLNADWLLTPSISALLQLRIQLVNSLYQGNYTQVFATEPYLPHFHALQKAEHPMPPLRDGRVDAS